MSRKGTGSATASYGVAAAPIVLTPPYTVAIWGTTANALRACALLWLGDKDSASDWMAIAVSATGKARLSARQTSGGVFVESDTAATLANNTPHLFVLRVRSATDRDLVVDGNIAGKASSTTSVAPAAFDRTALFAYRDNSPSGGAIWSLGMLSAWTLSLSDSDVEDLWDGLNPRDLPTGLVDVWPLNGSGSTEAGVLGSGIVFTMVGAPADTFTPPVDPPAPPPEGGGGGGGTVTDKWCSGLLFKKHSVTLPTSTTFDAVSVPSGPATRKMFAIVAPMFDLTATTITSVTFAGQAMTFRANNGYSGTVAAAHAALYELDNPPAGSGQLVVNADKGIWSNLACIWVFDGADVPTVFETGALTAPGTDTISDTIATEVGAYVIGLFSHQGNDGEPVTLTWSGATNDGSDAFGTSLTTDPTGIAASKAIASGSSESIQVEFNTGDGQGWLIASIPPAPSSDPDVVKGTLFVGSTPTSVEVEGQIGKAAVMAVRYDDAANEITVFVDGEGPVTAPWTGTRNPPTGDLIIGAALLAGAVQDGNDLVLNGVAISTEAWTDGQVGVAMRDLAKEFRPEVPEIVRATAAPGEPVTIDLSTAVRDPSNHGWEVTAVQALTAGLEIAIGAGAHPTTVEVDSSAVAEPFATARVRVASRHPLQPSTSFELRLTLEGFVFPDRSATTASNAAVLVEVTQGFLGPDEQPVTLIAVSDPLHGQARVLAGVAIYTPDPDYVGQDSLVFTVQSASGLEAQATLTITVTAASIPPVSGSIEGLPVRWADPLSSADVGKSGATLMSLIRQRWGGVGKVGFLDDHQSSFAKHFDVVEHAGKVCYRYRYYDADTYNNYRNPVTIRANVIGPAFGAANTGYEDAVLEYFMFIPTTFNNVMPGKTVAAPIKMPGLIGGWKWYGNNADDLALRAINYGPKVQISWAAAASQITSEFQTSLNGNPFQDSGDFACRHQLGGRADIGQLKIKPYLDIIGRRKPDGSWDRDTTTAWSPLWSPNLPIGRWFRICQRIKLNTPGQSNGILQGWIDDNRYCNLSNINYRGGYSFWKLWGVFYNHSWGGLQVNSAGDLTNPENVPHQNGAWYITGLRVGAV